MTEAVLYGIASFIGAFVGSSFVAWRLYKKGWLR